MFKSNNDQIIDIEELTWKEAYPLVNAVAPKLAAIINRINPSDSYTLFKAKYPFGVKIIDKSDTFLPIKDGGVISFNDESLPKELSSKLGYDPIFQSPMGLVLDKNSEFYLSTADRILPYAVVKPGNIFGTGRILDNLFNNNSCSNVSFFMWELTSGVRSLFLLPKITSYFSHRNLKNSCGITSDAPKTYKEHWGVFSELCDKLKPDWSSGFLFFSNKWINSLKLPEFSELYIYLLNESYNSYKFWHDFPSWQVSFDLIEKYKNVIAYPYVLNTIRHLFMIAGGEALGFRPATDENFAPISFLQDVYFNNYDLRGNLPTIMHVDKFYPEFGDPIYYSLNYPTLNNHYVGSHNGKSLLHILDEVRFSADKYKAGIKENSIVKATSLFNAAQNANFTYYHSTPDKYHEIKHCERLDVEDPRFMIKYKKGEFAQHGPFVVACVKISITKK